MRLNEIRQENLVDAMTVRLAQMLLSAGIEIRYYGAYSTKSRYMKLDDGVMNTVRISDHRGKAHLKYRYEIGPHINKRKTVMKGGYPSHLYPAQALDALAKDIIEERDRRVHVWGKERYAEFRRKNMNDNVNAKGFWSKAVPLQP